MANGIYNVNGAKAIRTVNFGEGNGGVYYQLEPMKNDSFNGKTLLATLAATAGLMIFRKNIGKFVSKHFPKVAEWATKNVLTPASEFLTKHGDNAIVKGVKSVLNKTATWGEQASAWLAKTFGNTTNKAATKTNPNVFSDVVAPNTTSMSDIAYYHMMGSGKL